jgi:hypothetical protein
MCVDSELRTRYNNCTHVGLTALSDQAPLRLHPSMTTTTPLFFTTFEVTRQVFHRTPLAYAIVNLKPIVPGRPYHRAAPLPLPTTTSGNKLNLTKLN